MNTSFDTLIGWSYSRTKNGEQGDLSKQEGYETRYINDRVETELAEFQEEIARKFKVNKTKNFVFPRKSRVSQDQYGK